MLCVKNGCPYGAKAVVCLWLTVSTIGRICHNRLRTGEVMFVADDLAAWLIGLLADRGRKRLVTVMLGTEQERALRSVVAMAVQRTAEQLCPDDDNRVEYVARVISQVFNVPFQPAGHNTLLEALRAGISRQLAVLNDTSMTGIERSSADVLELPGSLIAEHLTGHLLREIMVQGARGGPLFPLASQLNDDMTHLDLHQLDGKMQRQAEEIREALAKLDASFTSTARLSPRPAQLPPDISQFTGRKDELARLHELCSKNSDGRALNLMISSIDGSAGVGKTALALHLAHELAPQFPDAQLYVNLHGYDSRQRVSPTRALDRFLRALGIPNEAIPVDIEEQTALYRSILVGQRALVVLDNASSAAQVRPLLPGSPSCMVLITRRHRLAGLLVAEGANTLSLDPLTDAEALLLLGRVAGRERVNADPNAAAKLVQLCGCLPLALRIVAARLATQPTITLAALAERLRDERHRLADLSVDDVSVRATFDFSYQQLNPEQARMFRRLGLITGPSFRAGIASVLAETIPDRAEEVLHALSAAHLIEPAPGSGRYRFHDLLAIYAREKLLADESDGDQYAALERMLAWYLDTASDADRYLLPGRRRLRPTEEGQPESTSFATQVQALEWFEQERANLVAAVLQASTEGLPGIAWQLADSLWSFFLLRKYWADWQETHIAGIAAAQTLHDQRTEAWMLAGLARAYLDLRKFDDAIGLYERALTLRRGCADTVVESRIINNIGNAYLGKGRFEEAVKYLREALTLCQESGDRYREGRILNNLGEAYQQQGHLKKAIGCRQQALAAHREVVDAHGEAVSLHGLGDAHRGLRHYHKAIDYYRKALAIHSMKGNRYFVASVLYNMGTTFEESQRMDMARSYWRESLAIFTDLGAPEADDIRVRLGDEGTGPHEMRPPRSR